MQFALSAIQQEEKQYALGKVRELTSGSEGTVDSAKGGVAGSVPYVDLNFRCIWETRLLQT